MGMLDQRQLFLDKFIPYNETRYESEPEKAAAFTGLTLAETTFGAITKFEELGVYRRTYASVSSTPRNFTSDVQHFNAPNFASATITDAVQLAGIAEVRAAQPGVYFYIDAANADTRTLCVVYPYDMDTSDAEAFKDQIFAMLNGACKYAILKEDLDIQDWPHTVPEDKMTYVQSEVIAGWALTVRGPQETLIVPETDYGNLITDPNAAPPSDVAPFTGA